MADKITPQRQIGQSLFDSIMKYASDPLIARFYGIQDNGFYVESRFFNNYKGGVQKNITSGDSVFTNPYGVPILAKLNGLNADYSVTLKAGQSYNYATGQYSDPNLNPLTAQRLNDATNYRAAYGAGLSSASATSQRNQSVLGTLDQMYFGNQNTPAPTGTATSNLMQAKASGINTGTDQRTILGADTKPKTSAKATALQRALS